VSIAQLINRPCTLVRRVETGTEDDFENIGPDEDFVDTVCEIQQQRRDEPATEGELSVTSWLVIFPAGTEVKSGDAVLIDDAEFELVGAPWHARNPRTKQEHHVEATAKQTRGPGGS
jgi:hypothetical protein